MISPPRRSHAALLTLGCLTAAALGAGCDTSAPTGERPLPAPSVTVLSPPVLTRLRVPDASAIRVVLTLDGEELATSGQGDSRRSARFAADRLAADGTPSLLVASWVYDLDGTTLELALSEPLEVTRDSERALVLDRYDMSADRDRDGRSNVDELRAGDDPLTAEGGSELVLSSGPDCRWFVPDGVPRPLSRPAINRFSVPMTQSFTIAPNAVGDRAWYGAFSVGDESNLRIPQLTGLPVDTDALFYRRAPAVDTVDPSLPSTILTLSDTRARAPDGGRAVVPAPPNTTLPVEPSIVYCYVLLASEPLVDTVIEVTLTSATGGGG